MSVGEKIKAIRKQNKLTLKELNFKTGLSISFISDIENERRNPSIDNLKILANALGVPSSELLSDEDNLNENLIKEKFEILEEDMKILFSKVKKLSKEDRQKVIKMLDIFTEEK